MRVVCAALLGAVALASAAQAEPPPLSVYAGEPGIRSVSVSSDGSDTSFLRADGDTYSLYVLPASGAINQIILGATEIKGADWIDPDHILIIHSSMLEVPGVLPRQDISQGISYNLRTHHKATILENTAGTVPMLAGSTMSYGAFKGKPTVYLRGLGTDIKFHLYRADAETGRGELLDPGSLDSLQWIVTPDGRMVAKSEYDPSAHTWQLYGRHNGDWRLIKKERTEDPPTLDGLGREENSIILNRRGNFVEVSTETGIENADLGPPGSTITAAWHNSKTDRFVAVSLFADTPTYAFFDPALKSQWDKVVATFPGKRVYLDDFSSDYSQILARVDGAGDPGAYYWVHLDQKKAEEVGSEYPELKPDQVGPIRKIEYPAQDGLSITAYLTLPPGGKTSGLPLVVLVHGGPLARDSLGFHPFAQALASRGYAVLQANYRGSYGGSKVLEEAGYGQWGRKMQTDLSDGVSYLAGQGIIDPKRVCIMGAGYGGYAALAGVTLQSSVYKCAVAVNPIADLPAALKKPDSNVRGPLWDRILLWEKYVGANASAVSPLKAAAQASGPILLIHGFDQQEIPIEHSRRMYDALTRAKKPVEFVTLKGDHDLSTAAARLRMLEAALHFLGQNNPAN